MAGNQAGRSPGSFLRRVTRKLLLLLLVVAVWSSFSLLISAMLSTATLPVNEAQGVIENLRTNETGFLWGFVIPVAFFLVVASRPRR